MFRWIIFLELNSFLLAAAFAVESVPASNPFPPRVSLSSAIRSGQLERVKHLLASGGDVNERDEAGSTPLIVAVLSDRPEVLRYLIDQGADVNARQLETDSTALLYAVLAPRIEMVRTLLSKGADPNLSYSQSRTALHLAANPAVVDLLIAGQADIEALDESGLSPLDEAVLHGRTEIASLLLRAHADPARIHPADGRGPLHEAAIKGYPALVPLLVAAGADPAAPDRWRQTPLDLALAYKNPKVVSSLLALKPGSPALQAAFGSAMETAVTRGRVEIARMLLDCGWNVNERTSAGSTYLNDAALKAQLGVVRLLLDRGARLDARNQNGGTPLHDAAISGNTSLLSLLLDRGAAIDARDSESGATPLMLAASMGHTAAVALLLERGADPSLKDSRGRTALSRAREGQDLDLVKLLQNASG
ncbi:MAG: ankyrin repeat domain-containing protein [Acidobacteriota bacterium]|nr:ankyrin repeat domain-containing protein [Acidobacteriota bacterium]